MIELVALFACLLLAGLAVFQFSLAMGAPIGAYAWGGAHRVLPPSLRFASAVSIILYGIFAVVILGSAGLINSGGTSAVGVWILTAYFSLGVFMNAMSRSKHERMVMTPTALALAVSCLYIALN